MNKKWEVGKWRAVYRTKVVVVLQGRGGWHLEVRESEDGAWAEVLVTWFGSQHCNICTFECLHD